METSLNADVRIFQDSGLLADGAAKIFAATAGEAIAAKGSFAVALSGGSTPRTLFRLLGTAYRDKIKWDAVHLFWTDERAVPPDHEESNYRLAYEELISKITISAQNVHRIRGELDPAEAAVEYEREMALYFVPGHIPTFDLILLGVGQDGHTASLFPGSDALHGNDHIAVPLYSKSAGNRRVTLTLPVLNNAKEIVFLVSGKSKALIISEILTQRMGNRYPAGLIKTSRGNIIWLLDSEAASALKVTD